MVDEHDAPTLAFPFEVEYPLAHLGRLFGVQPEKATLELDGERVVARFGPWTVETTIDNIESVDVTGPYATWKVAGPPHISLADGGLTFATTASGGVCMTFREPVPGILPVSVLRHGSLTVTVQNPERVAEILERMRLTERRSTEEDVDEKLGEVAHDALIGATASELRAQAEHRGVEHASRTSKAELVEILSNEDDASTEAEGSDGDA